MSDIAINVEGLSKQYKIGKKKSGSFRDSFSGYWKKPQVRESTFLALKDLNFEIKKGEAVGIIGRNGAGKSTLLKILSRITEPTTGRIEINGRLASLLEVGTGFHPELTGRENIYLNGTILGMKRWEIKSKLDEIIDFSGVEKFIDTPVKHYSSGMYVRLAFAVAAHLEPEILVIDEVLAVGDAEFQKKCLGKMEDVAGEGRTVIFVSHNMGAMATLCSTGILLNHGTVTYKGEITDTLSQYNQAIDAFDKNANGYFLVDLIKNIGSGNRINSIQILCDEIKTNRIIPSSTVSFVVEYNYQEDLDDPVLGFVIRDSNNDAVLGINNRHLGIRLNLKNKRHGSIKIVLPSFSIYKQGRYTIDFFFGEKEVNDVILRDAAYFFIDTYDVYHSGRIPEQRLNKVFLPKLQMVEC